MSNFIKFIMEQKSPPRQTPEKWTWTLLDDNDKKMAVSGTTFTSQKECRQSIELLKKESVV